MAEKKIPKWMIFLSWITAAFCDPFEYSECVRPLDKDKLKNDVIYQFEVGGLAYATTQLKEYENRIIFAVNVASF